MSAFTTGKVGVAWTRGQGPFRASLLALMVGGCGHDAARTIIVEADTTGASIPAAAPVAPGDRSAEVAFLDDAVGVDRGPVEGAAGEERGGARSATGVRGYAGRARAARGGAGDARVAQVERDDPRDPGARPPPPVLLPSGRVLLPSGTILAAELRTPLHTATTMVGDRFAARLTQAVAAGGRIVIPLGSLVEGRVSHAGNASAPATIAFLHLKAKSVRLADGRQLRISAEVLDVTGQEVMERSQEGGRAGGGQASAPSGAAADARRAMLDSILIGLGGRAIVAGTTDKEIVIPAGTPFTLELVEPLELPAS